jgi:hypothetical protein
VIENGASITEKVESFMEKVESVTEKVRKFTTLPQSLTGFVINKGFLQMSAPDGRTKITNKPKSAIKAPVRLGPTLG